MFVFPDSASTSPVPSLSFYITGGTLPPEALSYVERQADQDLLDSLLAGHYCYVLNSRQMGKSSLCVRTIGSLKAQGFRTCFLDLTKFGGKNLTAEQWYAALLSEAGRELELRTEFVAHWKQHSDIGPMQRFFGVMRDLALPASDSPLVVFVDEIDVTRSLPFSTDEFFAGIRQCYIERATNPVLKQLTFCLLGTATPAELIQDTRVSPFNIGRRIEVKDFTAQEVAPLAIGLDHVGNGSALLKRALYWTGGHPYLTQRLCRAAAEASASTPAEIDRLCHDLFLSHTAKESDDNLAFVRNRLLKSEADLVALLDLYRQMWRGKRVADDETNPLCGILKLSGVCKVEAGLLTVRNRIYAQVFDVAWAEQRLPDAERRRQKQAFRRGLSLAGAIAGVVLSVITFLAVWAIHNAHIAHDETTRANRKAEEAKTNLSLANQKTEESDQNLYVANMNLIQREWDSNNVGHVQELLNATQARGRGTFEWSYWNRLSHFDLLTLKGHNDPVMSVAFSPDGKRILTGSADNTARVQDAVSRQELLALKGHRSSVVSVAFSPDGKRILTGGEDSTAKVWDAFSGKELLALKGHNNGVLSVAFSLDGKRIVTTSWDKTAKVWDAANGQELLTLKGHNDVVFSVAFSPNGKRIVTTSRDRTAKVWFADDTRLPDGR